MEHSVNEEGNLPPKSTRGISRTTKPVRAAFGEMLRILQEGITLEMPDSRPMPIVALGVDELRTKDTSGQYRAFYLKKSKAGILVLRAFHKKSQETPLSEIKLARKRLQELLNENS